MRKNKNLISVNLRFSNLRWKLSSLFFLFLTLYSSSLFASENPVTETFVTTDSTIEINDNQKPIVYVSDGITIHGLENILIKKLVSSEERQNTQKTSSKKENPIVILKKKEQKVKLQRPVNTQEVQSHITSNHPENFFGSSKQQFQACTPTVNHFQKSALSRITFIAIVRIEDDTHSIFEYSTYFKDAKADFFSFTRPPPFE